MKLSAPKWFSEFIPSRKHLAFELLGTTIVAGLATIAIVFLRGEVNRAEIKKLSIAQQFAQGRSFVANRGSIVYIGVVHSATVAEAAHVLAAMGMENALNLDNGGSTALWSGLPAQAGGYKVGPGRNLPNAILFVSK